MNNNYIKPLKYVLLPTITIYLIFALYYLSFVEPIHYFFQKENGMIRVLTTSIEVLCYILLIVHFNKKRDEVILSCNGYTSGSSVNGCSDALSGDSGRKIREYIDTVGPHYKHLTVKTTATSINLKFSDKITK